MSFHQSHPNRREESVCLPPGFRFHPTDEELVRYYLTQKVLNRNSVFQVIGEVDFNKCEPWDLPVHAKVGHQNMFYFFSLKDRKYPTGMRTNRATVAGYWKATGKDREVSGSTGKLLGMKKTLVFYMGRAPKGEKSNWIMHEYRLEGDEGFSKPPQEGWVVCRVFQKSVSSSFKRTLPDSNYVSSFKADNSSPQTPSQLPALQSLDSPGSSNFAATASSNLHAVQGYFQGATFPVHADRIVKRSNSSIKSRREMQYGDTLENLISGWDMGSPVPIWEVNSGPRSL